MIYIILPVHNRKDVTKKFISCLLKQTYQDFKLILIDDGSTDGTDKMVLNYLPKSHVIYGNGNLWWAGSLQKGYDWLKSNNVNCEDVILLINDDTEFDDNFLETALSLLKGKADTLLKAWSIDKHSKRRGDGYINADVEKMTFTKTNIQREANCASTRGLFFKVKDWYKIGGFYPKILPHYWSDYEFTIRASKKNYTILCDEKLFLYSDGTQTGYHKLSYTNFYDFIKKYFSTRNISHPIYRLLFIYLSSANYTTKIYYSFQTISHILGEFYKAMLLNSNRSKKIMSIREIRIFLTKNILFRFAYNKYKKYKTEYQLEKRITKATTLKLVVGASNVFDKGWIPTDEKNLDLLRIDDWKKYFKPNSIDAILAEHVWEHLTLDESSIALKNCFNYLKHGGYFRIAVPDGFHPDEAYIEHVKIGGTGLGSDDHKVLYTYKTLHESLDKAGFECRFLEYFDENGKFNFIDWGPEQGTIHRSSRFDSRNHGGLLTYTSIIVDAYKK